MQQFDGLRADAGHRLDPEIGQELELVPGGDFADAARLRARGRQPRHRARTAEPLRHRQARFGADLRPQRPAQRRQATFPFGRHRVGEHVLDAQRHAGQIGVEVVERTHLDHRREAPHHLGDPLPVALREPRIALAHDELRAAPQRLVQRHRRLHPARLGLVRTRRDDAGADRHRPTTQRRIAELFDRGEEGIDVEVQDAAVHRHTLTLH